MSHRHRLSLAVLPAVVAGAMFVPVSAAVASEVAQAPVMSAADEPPTDETADAKKTAEQKKAADEKKAAEQKKAQAAKEGGLSAEEKMKEDAAKKAAAGEGRPPWRRGRGRGPGRRQRNDHPRRLGRRSAAARGRGTFVVRRRSAGRREV